METEQLPSFDIFRITGPTEARWIESVSTLVQARKRVSELIVSQESEYLIFDQTSGERISVRPDMPH